MLRKTIIFASLVTLVIFLSSCNGNQAQTQPSQTRNTAAPATANSITIQNFSFSPAELKIKNGTTITWTNNDSAPHTIKSATFNSVTMANGDKFEFKFEKTGTFDYACGIHPSMKGKIVVE